MFGGIKIDEATINELCAESRGLKEVYRELLKINRRLGGKFVPLPWDVQKYIVENEYFKLYKNSSIVDLSGRIVWLKNNVSAIKTENEDLWRKFSPNRIINKDLLSGFIEGKAPTSSKGVSSRAEARWTTTDKPWQESKLHQNEESYFSYEMEEPPNERRVSIADSIMRKVDKVKAFALKNFQDKQKR